MGDLIARNTPRRADVAVSIGTDLGRRARSRGADTSLRGPFDRGGAAVAVGDEKALGKRAGGERQLGWRGELEGGWLLWQTPCASATCLHRGRILRRGSARLTGSRGRWAPGREGNGEGVVCGELECIRVHAGSLHALYCSEGVRREAPEGGAGDSGDHEAVIRVRVSNAV
jgi:hypothetical protein